MPEARTAEGEEVEVAAADDVAEAQRLDDVLATVAEIVGGEGGGLDAELTGGRQDETGVEDGASVEGRGEGEAPRVRPPGGTACIALLVEAEREPAGEPDSPVTADPPLLPQREPGPEAG